MRGGVFFADCTSHVSQTTPRSPASPPPDHPQISPPGKVLLVKMAGPPPRPLIHPNEAVKEKTRGAISATTVDTASWTIYRVGGG